MDLTGEVVAITTAATTTTTTRAVTTGVPLRATPTQYALLVDVDTKESVAELQPGASGRVFAITKGQAANTS
nr:hypothetical protein [Tanacetum cinerariifolium]